MLFVISASSQIIKDVDAVKPISNTLIAVQKDKAWAIINHNGEILVNYRTDLIINRDEFLFKSKPSSNRFLIKEIKEGIPYFGYINKEGNTVLPCNFLNATPFNDKYAIVCLFKKVVKGKNQYLKKDIITYDFDEVVIDTEGNFIKFLRVPEHIVLSKERYVQPKIQSKFIARNLVATKKNNNKWDIFKLNE